MSGETCTCPDPAPSEGPGTPVVLPGKAHRRGCPVALDDVRSPLWWAAFLLTLILIGAVSWTWAGEVDR